MRDALVRGVASKRTYLVAPTLSTFAYNARKLSEAWPSLNVPSAKWSIAERRAMLARSEDRLRGLESKGPGLVTVTAVFAATLGLTVEQGWSSSSLVARALLVVSGVYVLCSFAVPLLLVGPVTRITIGTPDIEAAAQTASPDEELARRAAVAAQENARTTLKFTNLQNAARRELVYALVGWLLWVWLVPVTGIARREPVRSESDSRPAATHAPPPPLAPPLSKTVPELSPASPR